MLDDEEAATASVEDTGAACMVPMWRAPPAEGMCTAQCDNLLVVEAHPVEDVSDVWRPLGGVRQAAIRGALGLIVHILPARPPFDVRACTTCCAIQEMSLPCSRAGNISSWLKPG